MRKFSAGAALCASAFTTALAVACMTACAPSYPDEAYENHPVADLIAEYLHDPSDETFSTLTDAGLKKVSESELRAALGGAAEEAIGVSRTYLYMERTITNGGETIVSPIVYAYAYAGDSELYGTGTLIVHTNGKKVVAEEGVAYEDLRETYTAVMREVVTYQFLPEEGNANYECIAVSNFAAAEIYRSVPDFDGFHDTEYALTQFGPYCDDAVTPYLAGERVGKDMCMTEFAVTYEGETVGSVPMPHRR